MGTEEKTPATPQGRAGPKRQTFEMAVTADDDAQSAFERELVLRLASLFWRLRRATAIENGLFEIQAKHLLQFRQRRRAHQEHQKII
jgi:hypothetical protein